MVVVDVEENEYKKIARGVWNNAKIKPVYDRRRVPWTDELWYIHVQVFLVNVVAGTLSLAYLQTEFVPDEGWQSLEVAYHVHFGKGFLTWEWKHGLRSYIYPLIVGLPIHLLNSLNPGFSMALVSSARFLQAILILLGEQCYYHYVVKRYGLRTGLFSIVVMTTSWFLLFTGPRTLTNSFELALNMIGIFFLYEGYTIPFVGIVSLNFVVRPTSLIYWIAFAPEIFFLVFKSWRSFGETILVGISVLFVNLLIDYEYYGRPVLPWWNFFIFNFIEGKSAEFGVNPLCWYLYSAIPSILGLNTVIAYALFLTWPTRYVDELRVITIFVATFSFVAHKEIRFILPILPQFCSILGDFWGYLIETAYTKLHSTRWVLLTGFACSISAQLAAAFFFMGWHQAGILPASNFIATDSNHMEQPIIWVLMPCYSLPVHTYLHHPNASYEYFTCAPTGYEYDAPNLQLVDFRDMDLNAFVLDKIQGNLVLSPDYVMLYDYSTQVVLSALRSISNHLNYKICGTYFHTHFPFDNVGRQVEVLCRLRPIATI